jgi:PAS domain S-box-containing protein
MGWLAAGIVYSIAYVAVAMALQGQSTLSWFRGAALLLPPLVGVAVIVIRRRQWSGCQWLFWATIALGLTMSAIGLTGWAADEALTQRQTWLAWPAVFALFGSVAPLFALLAQPHRGIREPLAATTAVDIAGLAVVTGFLYSFFVTAPGPGAEFTGTNSLLIVSELQQFLVAFGMLGAAFVARRTAWHATYRRLALGSLASFVTLTLSNLEAGRGFYRSGFVYDFTWILPFAFYPWAASVAPTSDDAQADDADNAEEKARPRPWVIFAAVALIPFLDFALRRLSPTDSPDGFRDLSTAVTIISVLPLLVARIAAERAELQQADGTMRLLTEVIEQAQDLILVLTPTGHVRHANQAFCRAVGVSREELTRLRSRDLTAQEIVPTDDIEARVDGAGIWRGTLTRKRRDGSTFPVAAVVAEIVDERGRRTHVVSVERDISEERRLREQLIHSERLSAVGQLVAGVAHELNNPLQSVIGFTELMMRGEARPDVRRDLERVRSESERAAKIVRNLLAFVRRSTLERSLVDLNEIVRSTLALKTFDFEGAGLDVRADYAPDLPLVMASREEIQQVVLNLILNAEQATRETAPTGAIRVRTGSDPGFAWIEVADTGPGVPTELTGRIFEPFFTTKTVGQGTGLGLSISLGITEAHGGSLALVPSSCGATFVLKLPVAPAAARLGRSPAALSA